MRVWMPGDGSLARLTCTSDQPQCHSHGQGLVRYPAQVLPLQRGCSAPGVGVGVGGSWARRRGGGAAPPPAPAGGARECEPRPAWGGLPLLELRCSIVVEDAACWAHRGDPGGQEVSRSRKQHLPQGNVVTLRMERAGGPEHGAPVAKRQPLPYSSLVFLLNNGNSDKNGERKLTGTGGRGTMVMPGRQGFLPETGYSSHQRLETVGAFSFQ